MINTLKVDRPSGGDEIETGTTVRVLLVCRGFGAVRSATALALAGVLAFATVVARLAATLALT